MLLDVDTGLPALVHDFVKERRIKLDPCPVDPLELGYWLEVSFT